MAIKTIRPTTEVEAVNIILESIGEAPIPLDSDPGSLAEADANIEVAVGTLRETTREVLANGWRFNTLLGFELSPVAQYPWTDTSGATTTLNIFKLPEDALAWAATKCPQMEGLDLIERRSLKYTEGNPPAPVKVLFDRVRNRDGAEAGRYPHLYLDIVTSVDFEDMPETARRFATVVAARRVAQRVPVSDVQVGFSTNEERAALRALKRDQGETRALNLFNTYDAYWIAGKRPLAGIGYSSIVYPGGA